MSDKVVVAVDAAKQKEEIRKAPAASGVPEVSAEDKVIRALSAPSATNPVDNKDALGSASVDWEKKAEWQGATLPEYLPADVADSKDKKYLNAYVRDDLNNVVIRPGHVFTAAGRYHNVQDIEKFYDVESGQILPEGIYVVSERYLLSEFERKQLRG